MFDKSVDETMYNDAVQQIVKQLLYRFNVNEIYGETTTAYFDKLKTDVENALETHGVTW